MDDTLAVSDEAGSKAADDASPAETVGAVGPGESASPAPEASGAPAAPGYAFALVALLALMVTFRVAGPSDLFDGDQLGPASHSVDAAVNDAWLIQRGPTGELATQPPMYAWWGGAAIRAIGLTDEWVLKLPSLAAAAVTAAVVFFIARPFVGAAAACVAAAVWLANPLAFKLHGAARPDMLLAMWLAIATLAAMRQREAWRSEMDGADAAGSVAKRAAWIVLFWLAVAGGLLTKGPAALIAVVFLLGLAVYDGAWRASRPVLQLIGAAAGLGLAGWWLYAVLRAEPGWWDALNAELFRQASGAGAARRAFKPWDAPVSFAVRWLPWSAAFGIGVALLLAHRRAMPRLGWTAALSAIVVGAYLFQAGGRGDCVLPACAGAAVLAAALFAWATRRADVFRVLAHLTLGLVGAVGLSCSILVWLAPRPGPVTWAEHVFVTPPTGPDYGKLVWLTAGVAVAAGLSTLALIRRRNYLGGAMAGCFVMAGALGFFHATWDRAATDRTGDTILTLVGAARAVAAEAGGPAVAYQTPGTPVPALLGQAGPMDAAALERIGAGGGAVVASVGAWADAPHPWRQRGRVIAQTPALTGSNLGLLLIELKPAAD